MNSRKLIPRLRISFSDLQRRFCYKMRSSLSRLLMRWGKTFACILAFLMLDKTVSAGLLSSLKYTVVGPAVSYVRYRTRDF